MTESQSGFMLFRLRCSPYVPTTTMAHIFVYDKESLVEHRYGLLATCALT